MVVFYIIAGILVWILGSLATTWLFTFILKMQKEDGLETSDYFVFIGCWPLVVVFSIVGAIVYIIVTYICKGFYWFLHLRWLRWLNPLPIWDKVAKHALKKHIQIKIRKGQKGWDGY